MDTAKDALTKLRPGWDDDIIDKLNYFWTALILIIGMVTIGMKQYVGDPLQCWVPMEFKKYWEDYAEHYCFVENTYFVPMNVTIPETGEERIQRELGYYQWVPIVLALQAFMFVLPRLAWKVLNTQGFNVPAIIDSALEVKKEGKLQRLKGTETANNNLDVISKYIDEAVKFRRTAASKSKPGFVNGGYDEVDPGYDRRRRDPKPYSGGISLTTSFFGYYTTTVYLFIKIAYLANVIGQFFMMNRFLAPEYDWWGFGILNDLAHGRMWHESGHFPRVTLCDFTVRKMGQLQTYTIQCVLVLNMLNEKLYLFLWWWFLLVAILTILNLIYWIVVSLNPSSRRQFVSRYLLVRNLITSQNAEGQAKAFVDNYLKPDGVLFLRLVSVNAGEIACANLIAKLWTLWPSPAARSRVTTSLSSPDNGGFIESPDSSLSGK